MDIFSIGTLWRIAIRDLGRNQRRSILTFIAVAIGLALCVVLSGLMTGSIDGALQNSIRLQTGHVQVRAESYDEDIVTLEWDDLLDDPQARANNILSIPGVKSAAPRLWASGIIAKRDESINVRVFGIDPLAESSDAYKEAIIEGHFIDPEDREGVLIGQRLAKSMGLVVGDQINLMVNTSDEQPDEAIFTIRGLFNTNVPAYDDATVFLPLSKAQAITRVGDRASAIVIFLDNRKDADMVANVLYAPEYEILTWNELNQVLLGAVETSAGMLALMYMIVLAVVAVVVVNTLLMAVFERTREMGILASLGMKGRQILMMFLFEASVLGLVGMFFGIVLGSLGVLYLANVGWNMEELAATAATAEIGYGSTIYAKFDFHDILSLSLVSLGITLLGSLYPAWLAARLEPVEALRGL